MFLVRRRMDNMRKKKGQAIVELALALPLLIFFLCGVIDFGRILYASQTLNLINQEAVRKAGLGKSETEVRNYVKEKSPISDSNTIGVKVDPQSPKSGDYVTVTLSYEVKYINPVMRVIIGKTFTINTSSTIRVE